MLVAGTFEVNLTPQQDTHSETNFLHRLLIDKRFHGDLEAVSQGQMLSVGTTVEDSAGYIALERVTGSLHERSGSFILQHNGIMARGIGQLTISVVPDSGTAALTGLSGTMAITIVNGDHRYEFEYTLPEI